MCGKDAVRVFIALSLVGSPPRVRERRDKVRGGFIFLRITPACAGKTLARRFEGKDFKDHPRVCGKDYSFYRISFLFIGSPPRVRERLVLVVFSNPYCRITPACAGKTKRRNNLSCSGRDHPRVCGKDSHCVPLGRQHTGSPPRVRERRCVCSSAILTPRITPACAGKTCLSLDHMRLG